MNIDLTGKTALVTASTSGIGLAIARGLAGAGAAVIVNGRRSDVTDGAVRELGAQFPGASVRGISADLGTREGVDQLIASVDSIDILVNNLGIYEMADFFTVPDEQWMRYFETNVMSGVRLARHYMPGMLQRDWGRLIFISSESGVTVPDNRIHYGVTKAAMLAVARGLAEIARNSGVTSNSILVGITMTEHVERSIAEAAATQGVTTAEVHRQIATQYRPSQLLGRLASSEEVANMVVYTASQQASATTGAALRVEGGGIPTIF
ncbi:SDR family NAD(P)-dependent oxidoreductase [Sphingomonas sp. TDK1]|uniref:SDR family NAD(P)-dependent oxidoreductase n=2 Tax=Sphingomonas TaxID=13687 RepID=UPI0007DA1F76|nr:SDR family oxidoreductase [Sphingomonas sp. TDK1]OAN65881.1 oxidoreductase [Sphingomonas sp. TDK1]